MTTRLPKKPKQPQDTLSTASIYELSTEPLLVVDVLSAIETVRKHSRSDEDFALLYKCLGFEDLLAEAQLNATTTIASN